MDFFTLFPGLQPWVENLANVWPASVIAPSVWIFSVVEAVHLLALSLLGGCVIILNMRLMGVGLTNESSSEVERNLSGWMILATAVILLTGVAIGMSNAGKLYTSTAFFVKMVSMVAALLFSFGVSNAAARAEGKISMPVMIVGAVAFLIWLFSIGVFGTVQGSNPGSVHVILAGYAILIGFAKHRLRVIALATISILMIAGVVLTHFGPLADPDGNGNDVINAWINRIEALLLVIYLGIGMFAPQEEEDMSVPAKLIGLFSILSWVTVAAGGRWIGLSP